MINSEVFSAGTVFVIAELVHVVRWSRMRISRQDFIELFDVVQKLPNLLGVFSSEYLKVSTPKNHLVLEFSAVVACRLRCLVEGQFNESFQFCYVNRHLMSSFVLAAKDIKSKADFELELHQPDRNHAVLVIKNGRRIGQFAILDKESGSCPQVVTDKNGFSPVSNSDQLKKLVGCAVPFVSLQPSEPELCCVMMGKNIYAANQYSGLRIRQDTGMKKFPIPLMLGRTWSELGGEVETSGQYVRIRLSHGLIGQSVYMPASKNFPIDKFNALYSSAKQGLLVEMNRDSLVAVVKRYETYLETASDKEKFMHLVLTPRETEARLKAMVQGTEFDEPVKLEAPVTGLQESQEAVFGSEYFLPFVRAIEKEKEPVTLRTAPKFPYVFRCGKFDFFLARAVK